MAISGRVIALLIEALHWGLTIFCFRKCVCFVLLCCKQKALWEVRRRNEGISVVDANRFLVGWVAVLKGWLKWVEFARKRTVPRSVGASVWDEEHSERQMKTETKTDDFIPVPSISRPMWSVLFSCYNSPSLSTIYMPVAFITIIVIIILNWYAEWTFQILANFPATCSKGTGDGCCFIRLAQRMSTKNMKWKHIEEDLLLFLAFLLFCIRMKTFRHHINTFIISILQLLLFLTSFIS